MTRFFVILLVCLFLLSSFWAVLLKGGLLCSSCQSQIYHVAQAPLTLVIWLYLPMCSDCRYVHLC